MVRVCERRKRDWKEETFGVNVFTILIAVMVSQLYAYDKTYQIVCFKYLLIIVCLLYLSKAVFQKVSAVATCEVWT